MCNARLAEMLIANSPGYGFFLHLWRDVKCPWCRFKVYPVEPTHLIAFHTIPAPGCTAVFGLALYPSEVEMEYKPEDELRFYEFTKYSDSGSIGHFSLSKWEYHCKRTFGCSRSPLELREIRKVPTKLKGWHWRSSCRTAVAGDPNYGGGPANYLHATSPSSRCSNDGNAARPRNHFRRRRQVWQPLRI